MLTCIPDLSGRVLLATGEPGWQVSMHFWCRPAGARKEGPGPITLCYDAVPEPFVLRAIETLLLHHDQAWAMAENGGTVCHCCDRIRARYAPAFVPETYRGDAPPE